MPRLTRQYPHDIKVTENNIKDIKEDIELLNKNKTDEFSYITLNGITYDERKNAGAALLEIIKNNPNIDDEINIGNYLGFELLLGFNFLQKTFYLDVKNNHSYIVELGSDPSGNIIRIDNQLSKLPEYLTNNEAKLETLKQQFEIAKQEVNKTFPQEQELKDAMKRLAEVNSALNIDEKVAEIMEESNEDAPSQMYKEEYER